MEADLVRFGRPEPAALLGPNMDDGRTGQEQRAPERLEHRVDVVARHDPDVGDPEILEQLAGLGEVHDRLPQPPAQLEDRPANERDALDGPIVGALAVLPGPRQLDPAEIRRERADRRADRHLVVVEDDEHLRLALPDVVERLERQPAHERRVTDHDRDALEPVTKVACLGQPLGDGQPGPRMATVEHVVRRFGPPREATHAIELAERREPVEAAGQELVGVRLMAGVPHDAIARRLEQSVQGDGQLDDAKRRSEVAARAGHRPDDRVADLDGKLGELDLVEAAQIGGALEVREDRHGCGVLLDHRLLDAGHGRADGSVRSHVMVGIG